MINISMPIRIIDLTGFRKEKFLFEAKSGALIKAPIKKIDFLFP